jgi:hypothetical protein
MLVRRQLRRRQVLPFFTKASIQPVGIEACARSQHGLREMQALGHRVWLMPPADVSPYRKRQKKYAPAIGIGWLGAPAMVTFWPCPRRPAREDLAVVCSQPMAIPLRRRLQGPQQPHVAPGAFSSKQRRHGPRPRVDRYALGQARCALEQRRGLEQRRLAAVAADDLQTDGPAPLVKAARHRDRR